MRALLDPKVDFVFKKIFGSEKHPNILISFLNAVIKPIDKIKGVELKETDINKDSLEDKFSRLDVKAITSSGEHINIEIQLKNEYNMIKRSLYYWSRLYSEQLSEGENYSNLSRTICINLLNFKYLKTENFHSSYRLKERITNEELTDVQEIHFVEIPKLPKKADITDVLVAWIEFLKDPNSEEVRDIEMSSKEVREAKTELIRLSNDDKERELYNLREKANKDRTSALEKALSDGIEQGIEQEKRMSDKKIKEERLKTAKNLLNMGIDRNKVSEVTKLSIEEVEKI
ncbi:MAG: Rpn family recombination-promoting nuclease/putative transposase [Psychrilyobacter sp.]|uniref:Rpn family recombination-promoting nuclease/putative transposase n=1 Tax=Psychrilyobacter sp. TaxID=2586924 RepID=UPI003C745E31